MMTERVFELKQQEKIKKETRYNLKLNKNLPHNGILFSINHNNCIVCIYIISQIAYRFVPALRSGNLLNKLAVISSHVQ